MHVSNLTDLEAIRDRTARHLSLEKGRPRVKINFHMGTCGIAAGAKKLDALVSRQIEEHQLQGTIITRSGCAGLCSREPMVTIESPGLPPVKYCDLNEQKVQEIFEHHVLKGEPLHSYALAIDNGEGPLPSSLQGIPRLQEIPFFRHQTLWALRNRGLIDAETIDEAIANSAYFGLAKVLSTMTPKQ